MPRQTTSSQLRLSSRWCHGNFSYSATVLTRRSLSNTHLYYYLQGATLSRSFSSSSLSHNPRRSGHFPSSSSSCTPTHRSRARYSCATATGGLSRSYPAHLLRRYTWSASRRRRRRTRNRAPAKSVGYSGQAGDSCHAICNYPFGVRWSTATPCMGCHGLYDAQGLLPYSGFYRAYSHQNGRGNPGFSGYLRGPTWRSKRGH